MAGLRISNAGKRYIHVSNGPAEHPKPFWLGTAVIACPCDSAVMTDMPLCKDKTCCHVAQVCGCAFSCSVQVAHTPQPCFGTTAHKCQHCQTSSIHAAAHPVQTHLYMRKLCTSPPDSFTETLSSSMMWCLCTDSFPRLGTSCCRLGWMARSKCGM